MPIFRSDLYVKVFENRMLSRNIGRRESVEIRSERPFSHPRMLVGDFVEAQRCLKKAVAAINGPGLILRTRVLIQPMERVEGGLTQVEERLFIELALGSGAAKAIVWVGQALSDKAVQEKLR
jgi:rod shape-determining protein MreB